MNEDKDGDMSIQGLSNAVGISYELIHTYEIANMLKNWIPKSVAYSITNRFYGSDSNMPHSTFHNALKEFGF